MTEPTSPIPASPFRWFPEFLEIGRRRLRAQARLLGLCLVVGFIAGLGAVVFHSACRLIFHATLDTVVGYHPQPPGPVNEPPVFGESETPFRWWLLLVVPTVGGLASGALVYWLAPEAEGHGTDSAIAAYHHRGGYIRPRVPLVKLVASALTLGTGGSGGREGPIAQIGAGCGSWLAGLLRLRPADRRILMAAGMGAGIAAIFRAPLAGALFAAEVLYRSPDLDAEVIIPAALASIVAFCTFGVVYEGGGVGWKPLFNMSPALVAATDFHDPRRLVPYLLLAMCMAVLAMLYTRSFYGLTYLFRRLRLVPHLRPAVGAFLTAVVALVLYWVFGGDQRVLSVLSFGYGILQDMLNQGPDAGTVGLALLLLAVAIGKILTTGLTIGSGGSGGVFGPSMVIGGCAGGALGILFHQVSPILVPHPGTFVIIGMAGFFAAAAKVPFSTLVMVGELTGNYNLLLPTLWVCIISFLLGDEQSIYSAQVETRARSPAHQGSYAREVLAGLQVRAFITPLSEITVVRPGDRASEVAERLAQNSLHVAPVVDGEGQLLGVVALEEVLLVSQSPQLRDFALAADLMRADVTPLRPEHRLDDAMELFVESDLLALPVVGEDRKVIGIINRANVAALYLRQLQGPREELVPPDAVSPP
jgi:CIC family chloride channel protein